MPQLTPSAVHIDAPLTNLTLAYVQDQTNYVASKVFPLVSVDKQSDKYYTYNRGDMNRSGDIKPLAPGTAPERSGLSLSDSTYNTVVYGGAAILDEQTLANEDAVLDTRLAQSIILTNKALIKMEKDWVSEFFATSKWTTEVAGNANASVASGEVTFWDDYSNSTPIVDVTTARRAIHRVSGGFAPNTMVVGTDVRDKLINHPDVLARLNGGATVTNTALVTNAKLAEIFEVENFYVMDAVENTAADGASESNAYIGGKHALLCHTPASAGLMTPASGLIFGWESVPGVSMGLSIERFANDELRRNGIAEELQLKFAYDMKLVGPDLGYFFKDIVE